MYERVLTLLEIRSGSDPDIENLLCEIEDGTSALKIPERYPDIEGVSDKQTWADDIVAWWQRPDPELLGRGRRFNHGERIRNFIERGNQIDDVVKALRADQTTTRGIVQLLDPMRDDMANVDQRVPSFFSVHFLIAQTVGKLNAVAYFRKQQMRMWWPINVAEVAQLQQEVVKKLAVVGVGLKTGSIATFSAIAVDGTTKPRVVVPKVDRLAQDEPEKLWCLAYDLFFDDSEDANSQFLALFDDWRPTGQVEPDGVAVATTGLRVLSKGAVVFADRSGNEKGHTLAARLESLCTLNLSYAADEDRIQEPSERQVKYETWAGEVKRRVKEIGGLLVDLRQ